MRPVTFRQSGISSRRADFSPLRQNTKPETRMQRFLLAIFVAAMMVGCSTQPTQAPIDEQSTGTDAGAAATPGTTTSGLPGAGAGAGTNISPANSAAALRDPNNILSKRNVFFEYDSFTVIEQYKPVVEAHAKYLVANRTARIALQGHADERGSREYNIALGQKRAEAIRRMMTLLGVQEVQIETVSFGKEKPRNLGHDETAWAENRRVDIIYAGE
jgi:peptidoglycan-associated lipoprotein